MSKPLIVAVATASLCLTFVNVGAQSPDPFQSVTPKPPQSPPHRPNSHTTGQTRPATAPAPPEPLATPTSPGWVAVSGGQCYFWNSYPFKDVVWAIWSGGCKDGFLSGVGTLTWSTGQHWMAEYRDGSKNGHCAYYAPNGYTYVGECRENMANGHGVQTYRNGDRFEGEFHDERRNGRGVFTRANGDRFEGEFLNDRPNGSGLLVTGAQAYNGIWKDGCFKDAARRMALFKPLASCP